MKKLLFIFALLAWSPLITAGDNLNVEQYAGKVVLIDFWASWCVPCRRSFPWMNEMHEKYGEAGLVIIAVNVDRERENADAFLARYPVNFQILYDPSAALAKEYEVQGMPTSFVIDRGGEIIEQHAGFKVKKQGEYEAVILAALR